MLMAAALASLKLIEHIGLRACTFWARTPPAEIPADAGAN